MITIGDLLLVDARRLRDHGLEHVREQVGGMGIAEDAPGGLADGSAGSRDDVGVLDLLGHVLSS
jgi:hypothetical protein